jgi:hypothetical protein
MESRAAYIMLWPLVVQPPFVLPSSPSLFFQSVSSAAFACSLLLQSLAVEHSRNSYSARQPLLVSSSVNA